MLSNVPLYLAYRKGSISLAFSTYHPAPERLGRTWLMRVFANSMPPLPIDDFFDLTAKEAGHSLSLTPPLSRRGRGVNYLF
jgi:hypothetical protein